MKKVKKRNTKLRAFIRRERFLQTFLYFENHGLWKPDNYRVRVPGFINSNKTPSRNAKSV